MRFLTKLSYLGSGLGVLGAAWLWVLALLSGFSADRVVCYATGAASCTLSSSPYWQTSTVLWLAPLTVSLIFLAWFVPMFLLPKKTPPVFASLIVLCELIFLVYFVISFAAGNQL